MSHCTGPKIRNESTQRRQKPAMASFQGIFEVEGEASGDIASSGETRIALYAGRKLATSAANAEPNAPIAIPPQLTTTPATRTSLNIGSETRILTQSSPSGMPTATPVRAS